MKTFKGTKGEWKVFLQTFGEDTREESYMEVAITFPDGFDDECDEPLHNAKLIASAPDLLEACMVSKAIFDSQGIDETHRIVGEQYKLLIKAIEKAL